MRTLGVLDLDKFKEGIDYAARLSEQDKELAQTWLWAKATLAGIYYVLLAAVVFFLGRRIITAFIAAYREAKAESV